MARLWFRYAAMNAGNALMQPAVSTGNLVGRLEPLELNALRKGLAPESLKRRGWAVTPLGEVVGENGRTIFEPGFATGLRKLLGDL